MSKLIQQVHAKHKGGFAMAWTGKFPACIELYTVNGVRCVDYEGDLITCTHKEPSDAFSACLKTIERFKRKKGL